MHKGEKRQEIAKKITKQVEEVKKIEKGKRQKTWKEKEQQNRAVSPNMLIFNPFQRRF